MLEVLITLLLVHCVAVFLQRRGTPRHAKNFFFADFCALLFASRLYLFFLALFARPLVAGALASLVVLLLAVVNAAKRAALRDEPLLFSDVTLIRQVWDFPELYLPFLPVRPILLVSLILLPILIILWQQSFVLPGLFQAALLFFFLLIPLLFCSSSVRVFVRERIAAWLSSFQLTCTPRDALTYGPFGAALLHVLWHIVSRGKELGIRGPKEKPFAPLAWEKDTLEQMRTCTKSPLSLSLPDILLIQEESFCDPRVFLPEPLRAHSQNLLCEFDTMASEGHLSQLCVHAYGAYTMRTEYEVLTGIEAQYLGTDAFHPYWGCLVSPSWSIAQFLRGLGYRIVCVHPFDRRFFYRDRALPNLGFDEFIALDNFPNPRRFGPYVSDMAVADCVLHLLNERFAPLFCFVITMENHGPWRADRFAFDSVSLPFEHSGLDPEVSRYLLHIQNCNAMLGYLRQKLMIRSTPSVVAVYGDHLPGLPSLIPKERISTPCLLWSSRHTLKPNFPSAFSPAALGGFLLKLAADACTGESRDTHDLSTSHFQRED